MLIKDAEVNVRDGLGHTALIEAARGGHSSVIMSLVLAGAKINTKEKTRRVPPEYRRAVTSPGNGKTALMYAALEGHNEAVKTLIKGGANVNQRAKGGWNALYYTLFSLDKTTRHIKTLINNGANVNSKPRGEDPILYHAISMENPEVVRALLEKGANPNTKWKKSTPLKQAKKLGNKEIYMLLRNAGARK